MKYDLVQIPLRTFNIVNQRTILLSSEKRAEEYFKSKGFYFLRGSALIEFIEFRLEGNVHNLDDKSKILNIVEDKLIKNGDNFLSIFLNKPKGIPDYFIFNEEGYYFVEVKGLGDSIPLTQIKYMSFLMKFNIPCFFLIEDEDEIKETNSGKVPSKWHSMR